MSAANENTAPQTDLHRLLLDARDSERAANARLASMKPGNFIDVRSVYIPIAHQDVNLLVNLREMAEGDSSLGRAPRFGEEYSRSYSGTAFNADGEKFAVSFTLDHMRSHDQNAHRMDTVPGRPPRDVSITGLNERAAPVAEIVNRLGVAGLRDGFFREEKCSIDNGVVTPLSHGGPAEARAVYAPSSDGGRGELVAAFPSRDELFAFMRDVNALYTDSAPFGIQADCANVNALQKFQRQIDDMEKTMSAQNTRQNTDSQKPKRIFNNDVANQLAAQLRDGVAPMQWKGVQDIPYNPSSGRPFHGINALNLMMQDRRDDRWMTFDEASQNGYRVRAGEKATAVQYWAPKQEGETKNRAITAYVFNGEQLDRIPPMPRKPERPDPMERVAEILKNSGMKVIHDQAENSFYAPRKDEIHLPKPENCKSGEEYCEKALYEYFRASGHPDRLNRETFGSVAFADRSTEALVCTVATMTMCAEIGIPHDPARNLQLREAWAKSMEHHPIELAQAVSQADKAVWSTLRQEQARNISLGLQSGEQWRPVPDASPSVAVQSFLDRKTALDLARNEPEKVHTFEYQNRDIYALPEKGIVLSKEENPDRPGEVAMRVKAEAYDRDGGAYSVTMRLTAMQNENGLLDAIAPAQALDIAPADKNMSLPLDWNGSLDVRGCAEDREGNVMSAGVDENDIQFYGVYAATDDGHQYHVADFDRREDAERYAKLVAREYDIKTGRVSTREAEREKPVENSRKAPESEASPREECVAAMRSVGMIASGEHPVFDKKPHRIAVEGDKKGELSGFYVAHDDGRPSGYVKNNRTGEEKRWSAKGYILDDNQKKALHEQARENVAKRDNDLAAEHDKTAWRLQGNMKRFTVPSEPTPYLKSKGVGLHPGVYQNGNSTCIPLQNIKGEVRSMTYIQEDGTKRYAKNSEKEGNFHVVGGMESLKKAPAIIVAEGYATAATITEAVGMPVVAAFDAGNLMHVAKALQNANPDKPIIIAADNDARLEAEKGRNPGKNHALDAARAVNGVAVFPKFGVNDGKSKFLTDFNDLAHKHGDMGKEAVKSQLQPTIDKVLRENAKEREAAAQEKSRGEKELSRA